MFSWDGPYPANNIWTFYHIDVSYFSLTNNRRRLLSLLPSTNFFSAEASYVLFLDNGSGNQCGFDIIQFMYIVASINLLN